MKTKVITYQIKEEKIEKNESVSYRFECREREGKDLRERLRQSKRRNLKIDQIQVKFYQLFATVIR
jgi:hypothetical protein